jgi:hypothetical protein
MIKGYSFSGFEQYEQRFERLAHPCPQTVFVVHDEHMAFSYTNP